MVDVVFVYKNINMIKKFPQNSNFKGYHNHEQPNTNVCSIAFSMLNPNNFNSDK